MIHSPKQAKLVMYKKMKYILEKCLGMLVYILEMFKNPIKKLIKGLFYSLVQVFILM